MATKATVNQLKYDKTHCRTYGLKLNLVTDADIIEKLSSVPSMQGYIKQLIRDDITRTQNARIALFPDHASDITTLSDEMYIDSAPVPEEGEQ